ncbi:unnamed protein product [Dracunculus medinensis]|uniref:Protein kinase domain-containing protein n=1 Tax=Dracunculus medinensis TaxID=318479 RepID=A0A0N4UN25_DRAME|nr:unnamed protein product [Dracunculus medinensis]
MSTIRGQKKNNRRKATSLRNTQYTLLRIQRISKLKFRSLEIEEIKLMEFNESILGAGHYIRIIYDGRELPVRKPNFLPEKTKYINRSRLIHQIYTIRKVQHRIVKESSAKLNKNYGLYCDGRLRNLIWLDFSFIDKNSNNIDQLHSDIIENFIFELHMDQAGAIYYLSQYDFRRKLN